VEIEFLDIENIHQMRESLEKFRRLCFTITPAELNWYTKAESTGWMAHISSVLRGALRMALYVHKGHSVVLHCSHGWDRTAQLSGTAQLLLDPHYRTIRGFEQLIEKEWVSFGHRIQDRAAHLTILDPTASQSLKEEESPIFLQYIDCVYQLLHQFPTEFEFTEEFLRVIVAHYFSCQFGTFLANSEQEQFQLNLRKHTVSLWTFLNHPQNIKKFQNPFFRFARHFDTKNNNSTFLHASSGTDQLVFWSEMYHGPDRIKIEKKQSIIHKGIWDIISEVEKLKMENAELKIRLEKQSSEQQGGGQKEEVVVN